MSSEKIAGFVNAHQNLFFLSLFVPYCVNLLAILAYFCKYVVDRPKDRHHLSKFVSYIRSSVLSNAPLVEYDNDQAGCCINMFDYSAFDQCVAFAPKKDKVPTKPPSKKCGRVITAENCCFCKALETALCHEVDLAPYITVAKVVEVAGVKYYGFDLGMMIIIIQEFMNKERLNNRILVGTMYQNRDFSPSYVVHVELTKNQIRIGNPDNLTGDMDFVNCFIFTEKHQSWMPPFNEAFGGHVFVKSLREMMLLTVADPRDPTRRLDCSFKYVDTPRENTRVLDQLSVANSQRGKLRLEYKPPNVVSLLEKRDKGKNKASLEASDMASPPPPSPQTNLVTHCKTAILPDSQVQALSLGRRVLSPEDDVFAWVISGFEADKRAQREEDSEQAYSVCRSIITDIADSIKTSDSAIPGPSTPVSSNSSTSIQTDDPWDFGALMKNLTTSTKTTHTQFSAPGGVDLDLELPSVDAPYSLPKEYIWIPNVAAGTCIYCNCAEFGELGSWSRRDMEGDISTTIPPKPQEHYHPFGSVPEGEKYYKPACPKFQADYCAKCDQSTSDRMFILYAALTLHRYQHISHAAGYQFRLPPDHLIKNSLGLFSLESIRKMAISENNRPFFEHYCPCCCFVDSKTWPIVKGLRSKENDISAVSSILQRPIVSDEGKVQIVMKNIMTGEGRCIEDYMKQKELMENDRLEALSQSIQKLRDNRTAQVLYKGLPAGAEKTLKTSHLEEKLAPFVEESSRTIIPVSDLRVVDLTSTRTTETSHFVNLAPMKVAEPKTLYQLHPREEFKAPSHPQFETTIPAIQVEQQVAFASSLQVYLFGRSLPRILTNLLTPLLRVMKGPDHLVPIIPNWVCNINGSAINISVFFPPHVRVALRRGKRQIIGDITSRNHTSFISNWSYWQLIRHRSFDWVRALTYVWMKFCVPHWVQQDSSICNSHEYNLAWGFPTLTPFLNIAIMAYTWLYVKIAKQVTIATFLCLRHNCTLVKRFILTTISDVPKVVYSTQYNPTLGESWEKCDTLSANLIKKILYPATRPIRFLSNYSRHYSPDGPVVRSSWLVRLLTSRHHYSQWQRAQPNVVQLAAYNSIIGVSKMRSPEQVLVDLGRIAKAPRLSPLINIETNICLKQQFNIPLQARDILYIRAKEVAGIAGETFTIVRSNISSLFKNLTIRPFFRNVLKLHRSGWKHWLVYTIIAAGLTAALILACLRRHASYLIPDRTAQSVLYYGCGPCNPASSYLLESSGREIFVAIPYPIPPVLNQTVVTKRVLVNGNVVNATDYDLRDSSPSITNMLSEDSTYYWSVVGHTIDPVTFQPLHVMHAVRVEGDVDTPLYTQAHHFLALRGLPPPVTYTNIPPPPAQPEQYYRFVYYCPAIAANRHVDVRSNDFHTKLGQFSSLTSTISKTTVSPHERWARLRNAFLVQAAGITPQMYGDGVPVVAHYMEAYYLGMVATRADMEALKFEHDPSFKARIGRVSKYLGLDKYSSNLEHHNLYAIAFAPSNLEIDNWLDDWYHPPRVRQAKRKRGKRKPKGECVLNIEDRANVDFTCRSCGGYPPKKFRWFYQICPSCLAAVKDNRMQYENCYYDPEIELAYEEGLHPLGPPTQILPVQPKYKVKASIPQYLTDFKFGPQRGPTEMAIDRERGPQAAGVVTNVRCTVFNTLAPGRTHALPGENKLLEYRIFKQPTYPATQASWDVARQVVFHPNSYLMQKLNEWKERTGGKLAPFRFSDPESTAHAVRQGWVTAADAQTLENYLEEFDRLHSEGKTPNQLDRGRGWIHSFVPSRQREIWQEGVDFVLNGRQKHHHRCKLFMKMEKAPNCADFGPRPCANPRCIISFSNVTQMLAGRYTRAVTAMLHDLFSSLDNFTYAGGLTPEKMDEWLLRSLSEDAELLADFLIAMSDYSAFDTTQRKPVLDFWHQFLSHIGVPIWEDRQPLSGPHTVPHFTDSEFLLGWVFKAWSKPIGATTRRNKFRGPYMNCSGRGDTAAMNFFLNWVTQYLSYLYCLTQHPPPYNQLEYQFVNDRIRFIALGDDSLVFAPRLGVYGQPWTFADLQLAVSWYGFEFSEGKITDNPKDIIFLGMRPWPCLKSNKRTISWAPVLGRYLQKMGWRLDKEGDPYAWYKGICKAVEVCFPHLQIVGDIAKHCSKLLGHHTQSPITDFEFLNEMQHKIYYKPRVDKIAPDDERAIEFLEYLYGINAFELENIRNDISGIVTLPCVLSNFFLDIAQKREAS